MAIVNLVIVVYTTMQKSDSAIVEDMIIVGSSVDRNVDKRVFFTQ